MSRKAKSGSKYRDLILLSEIGAYLHDLGKLSKFFVLSKAKGMNVKDFHGQILFLDYEVLPPNLKDFLFSPISKFIGADEIRGIKLDISLSYFVCAHHGCSRCLKGVECAFKDVIEKHPLIKLLKTVDHLDASNPSNAGKQPPFNLYRDDMFYGETALPVEKFDSMRKNFYLEMENYLSSHLSSNGAVNISELNNFVKKSSEKFFANALSETRRYGNDITLLDHSNAVSSLYKAFLYAHLFWGKEIPNSFFNVRFRIMRVNGAAEETSRTLSNNIACCNEIAKTDDSGYYIVANFVRNSKFAEFMQSKVKKKIEFSKVNDFSFIFSGTFCGVSLEKIKDELKKLRIKNVSDICEGCTEQKAIADIKRAILFAELRKKEVIASRLKSAEKHLANLSKGSMHDPSNLPKFFKKEREIALLGKHLKAGHSMDKIKQLYGWKTSKDAEYEIYSYFNRVLSPVRPPSPIEMSAYLLKLYHKFGSYKKVFEEFLIKRPLVLGRVFAVFRNLKKFCENNK